MLFEIADDAARPRNGFSARCLVSARFSRKARADARNSSDDRIKADVTESSISEAPVFDEGVRGDGRLAQESALSISRLIAFILLSCK